MSPGKQSLVKLCPFLSTVKGFTRLEEKKESRSPIVGVCTRPGVTCNKR